MEYIVLDTNIIVNLLNKNQDVLTRFLNYIEQGVFIPILVYREFYNEFDKIDKGYIESKKIYDCNVDIKNIKKRLISENFEGIYKNLKLIRKNYNLKFDELNELINIKRERQNKIIELISNIKGKDYFQIQTDEIYKFFCEFTTILVEVEDMVGEFRIVDNVEKTKNLIKESICLFDELVHKIEVNKNIDSLYNNYSSIKTFFESNFNDDYVLSECEKTNIINHLNSNPNINWWGKKDITEKGMKNGYNDQFIWAEIIKFSKKTKTNVVLLTNDKKDFKCSNLKEDMIQEFHNKTGQSIRIIGLDEYDEMKVIEKQEKIKDIFEMVTEKEFLKIKDMDDAISEAIEFIENNSEKFSEYVRENKDCLDGLFDESFEDYENDEEYILAINALDYKKEIYQDFENLGVSLSSTFIDIINENQIVCNIAVVLDLVEQLECIITYITYINFHEDNKINAKITKVEFGISGKKYVSNNCYEETYNLEAIKKIMHQELCFRDYIKPIYRIVER